MDMNHGQNSLFDRAVYNQKLWLHWRKIQFSFLM